MEIFIDSGNIFEIKKWLDEGIIDGVTTDFEILHKAKISDVEARIKDISKVIGDRPLCVQVTSNDVQEMLREAEEIRLWAKNIVVSIPIIDRDGDPCLGVISKLKNKNIKVSVAGITSFNQLVMAAKAGGTYLNIVPAISLTTETMFVS